MSSIKDDELIEQVEHRLIYGPRARWRLISKVSPSGKNLFVCLSCGAVNITNAETCAGFVTMWNGKVRACEDWVPSLDERHG